MRGLQNRARLIAIALVVLPFWVSILVRTYAWIVVLGNGGLVNRALQWLGLTDAPVSFLYNELGVTIGMANVLLPFLVLPLFAAMIRIDDRLMQAAASLGAPPRTIFWKVYFPLTLPALAAGTLLVFILCLGFYVTPAVLGGGRVPMISNLLDTLINQIPRWEQASAISTILLIVTLLIFAAYRRLDRKASLHDRRLALDAARAGGGRHLRPGVPRPCRCLIVIPMSFSSARALDLPAAQLLAALVRDLLRRSALDGRDVDLDAASRWSPRSRRCCWAASPPTACAAAASPAATGPRAISWRR